MKVMEVKLTRGHRQLYIKKCTWLHKTNKENKKH